MRKHILVTGVTGFVGGHLVDAIVNSGHTVSGIGRDIPDKLASRLEMVISCDMTDAAAMLSHRVPESVDAVIHLASHASQSQSFAEPEKFVAENPRMLQNLQALLEQSSVSPRVIVVSSGAVYDSSSAMPLTEESPTKPTSPYVMSKLAVEELALNLAEQGFDYIIVRPFNHTGPGQSAGYIVPDLVDQVLHAADSNSTLMTGNLKTRRDYTDVRDVAQAYLGLALAGTLSSRVYNVASGKSTSGEELLRIILDALQISEPLETQTDPGKVRPHDPPDIYGSFDRLATETGWSPVTPLAQTIADFVSSRLEP